MLRKILAVIAGIISGGISVGIVQTVGHNLYPMPEGMKSDDMEAMKNYVETAPFMALFFVIISYVIAAVVSGFVSTKIADDGKKIYALICGIIFLIQSIYMMSVLPTPIWFWILGILSWTLVLVGYKLALNKK
ncbi:MAG: hypothetical protein K0R77_1473 [Chryseobacterium sp.]|jgi:hypothetical protein|uniref:hypothetical protein n=1 Tax=Chryseobacterium sp. TaxID=1871047 RepID=UPI00262D92C0|nr:hypothetical protein [Chryseobacterium sp.]MDF2552198.1 hypothetical protein [Chryseobacterium sp.]